MSDVNLVLILLAGGIGTRINRKISKQMIKEQHELLLFYLESLNY